MNLKYSSVVVYHIRSSNRRLRICSHGFRFLYIALIARQLLRAGSRVRPCSSLLRLSILPCIGWLRTTRLRRLGLELLGLLAADVFVLRRLLALVEFGDVHVGVRSRRLG